jgi:hypothetical protein
MLPTWLHWWTGVAVGVVTVAPVVIEFSAAMREPAPRREQIEGATGLVALAAMTGVILSLPQQLWETVVPGPLLFPTLLWLAARCRPVFAAGGVLLVSLTIAWTTIFGIGHFGNTGLPIDYGIAQAQAIIIATAIGAHVLAALFAVRRESEARLTRSMTTLEHERDNRPLNAQAITAAIAREIRQTLAAITINADAALRWIGRTPPDHDEVRAALTRIKTGGHRASEVFDGFRSLFGKSGRERQPIDVNRIILEVTNSLQEELNGHGADERAVPGTGPARVDAARCAVNPLSYGVDGLRDAFSCDFVFGAATDFAVLGGLACILLASAAWLFSKIEV